MNIKNDENIISIEVITIYQGVGDSDCEGRGPQITIGYFTNAFAAADATKNSGGMGGAGYVRPVSALKFVYANKADEYYLFNPIEVKAYSDEFLKNKVLEKLSPEERKILGFK